MYSNLAGPLWPGLRPRKVGERQVVGLRPMVALGGMLDAEVDHVGRTGIRGLPFVARAPAPASRAASSTAAMTIQVSEESFMATPK